MIEFKEGRETSVENKEGIFLGVISNGVFWPNDYSLSAEELREIANKLEALNNGR